jgi:digeranylgeranylglycerophospholipid reductase
LNHDYDLCVVGAGTGGCLAAKSALHHGLTVAIVDSKPKDQIGKKVCGDVFSVGTMDFLQSTLGVKPPQASLERLIEGVEVYSPHQEVCMQAKARFYSVDRRLLGQELLSSCLDSGAELFESSRFDAAIKSNGTVTGAVFRSNGSRLELQSKVTVDASGFGGAVRRTIPELSEQVDPQDVWVCYREIRELSSDPENPENLKFYIDEDLAPGGGVWIFPRSGTRVNAGVCTPPPTNTNPKKAYFSFLAQVGYMKDSKVLEAQAAPVPVRRPLETLVASGVMVVGDAGYQTSPINGGGIDMSMLGGEIAGRVAAQAIGKNDVSKQALWQYNREYMTKIGKDQALQDVFRLFLQGLRNDEINYGLKKGLLEDEELGYMFGAGEFSMDVMRKLPKAIACLRKPALLARAWKVIRLGRRMLKAYATYPAPDGLSFWKNQVNSIYSEALRLIN